MMTHRHAKKNRSKRGVSLLVSIPIVVLLGLITWAIVSYSNSQRQIARHLKLRAVSNQLATRARMLLSDHNSFCKFIPAGQPGHDPECIQHLEIKKSVLLQLNALAHITAGAKCPNANVPCGLKLKPMSGLIPDTSQTSHTVPNPGLPDQWVARAPTISLSSVLAATGLSSSVIEMKWVTDIIEKNATGAMVARPLPTSEHYLSYLLSIQYEGTETRLADSTFFVRKPRDLSASMVTECGSDAPIFRGFDSKGFAFCDGYANNPLAADYDTRQSLACNPNEFMKDIELTQTRDGLKPLPKCLEVIDTPIGCADTANPTGFDLNYMITAVHWDESTTVDGSTKYLKPRVSCGLRLTKMADLIAPPPPRPGDPPPRRASASPPRSVRKGRRVDYVLVKTKSGTWQLKNNKTGRVLGRFDQKSSAKVALVKKGKVMAKKWHRPVVTGERMSGQKTKNIKIVTGKTKTPSSVSSNKTKAKAKKK